MEPIRLSPRVYEALMLTSWNALPDHDRVMVADHLTERLEAAHWVLSEPLAVRTFGPPAETQAILQVRDDKTGLPFSLVPGGTFRPGIPDDLLAQFRTVYLAFESWKGEEWDEPDEDEEEEPPWEPESPNAVWPFASEAPCDLTQKSAQTIEPFLFAAELVTPRVPGLDKLVGQLSGYHRKRWERGVERFEGWTPRWEMVEPILQEFGWELPTTWEFEWAVRGGIDSLFYWGGPMPNFQADEGRVESGPLTLAEVFDAVMTSTFPPDRPRTWPYCNRFGLAALLGAGTWCRPSEEEGDEHPLILRGGGAGCWGWQGCKEWLLLLTACESRQRPTTNYADHNAIRPVVRLVPDSTVPLA